MSAETSNRYAINSVLRANAILRCLARENGGLRVGAIAQRLDLDRTTAFRLIATLEECGLVERVANTKEFKLGVGVFEIGSAYIRSTDLHSAARPVMIDLAHQVKESVHWAILAGDKAVCIDKIDSPRGLGTTSKIGGAVALNSGSVGKVLLAFQPEDLRERLLASIPLPRYTERTITSAAALRNEIAEIRRKGYCLSLGEGEPDMACVAAPIFDHDHRTIAGLSIGGSIQRFADPETARFLTGSLLNAAQQISEKMGCAVVPAIETAASTVGTPPRPHALEEMK
jgi:DNA-binding IclR family transcriptional regulator